MKRQLDASDPSEVMQRFLETGRDVLVIILDGISRGSSGDGMIEELLEWRTVCKEWNISLRGVKHICLSELSGSSPTKEYEYFLRELFPLADSIIATTDIINLPPLVCGRIRTLELLCAGDGVRVVKDLSHFTSLKTLSLLRNGDVALLGGLENLTTLTELGCSSDAFTNRDDIFSLTNLERLSIIDFFHMFPLKEKFPKLSHLESNNPNHFINFTGTGHLRIGKYVEDVYNLEELPRECYMGIQCDWYDAEDLKLDGEWQNGLFSGSFHVKFPNTLYHDSKWDTLNGEIHRNNIHGFVTMYRKLPSHPEYHYLEGYIIYDAYFLNGKQHGIACHNECSSRTGWFHSDMREEVWENDQILSSQSVDPLTYIRK